MRPCIIFNPAAKGDKARRFRVQLDAIAATAVFKFTVAAGDARRLAAEAVQEGHDTVVAAGGDGTLNEVLNGIGDVAGGFQRTRLGLIPLGTVNVFAREFGIPLNPVKAWQVIEALHETRLDLPWVECMREGQSTRFYFGQLAGAGLDARAIELVDWETKKRIGPLAYVLAGLRAMRERSPSIIAIAGNIRIDGELMLIGNGRLYGGNFQVFPGADTRDGLLDVCAFDKASYGKLLACGLPLLTSGRLPSSKVKRLQARQVRLESNARVPVEVDGELAGELPATFGVEPSALRTIVPKD